MNGLEDLLGFNRIYSKDEVINKIGQLKHIQALRPKNDFEKVFLQEEIDMLCELVELKDMQAKLKGLEEEIGCPLEVRCQLYTNRIIYGKRQKWQIDSIDKEVLVCYKPHYKFTEQAKYFKFSDYKVTWWLKQDKSE